MSAQTLLRSALDQQRYGFSADLRATLRLSARPLRAADHVVICRICTRTVCFSVDRAIDLTETRSDLAVPDLASLLDPDAELQLDRSLAAVA